MMIGLTKREAAAVRLFRAKHNPSLAELQRIGELKDRPTLETVAAWEAAWYRVRTSELPAPKPVAARFQKLHYHITFSTDDIQQIADYAAKHNLQLGDVVAWTRAWHLWRTEVGRRYDFTPVGGRNELAGGAL
jgi:hypothetical protein